MQIHYQSSYADKNINFGFQVAFKHHFSKNLLSHELQIFLKFFNAITKFTIKVSTKRIP